MRNRFVPLLVIVLIIAGVWYFLHRSKNEDGPVLKPITLSNHSKVFNESLDNMMDSYYGLTEGFVNWDTLSVNRQAAFLSVKLDSLQLNELKKDTTGILETARTFVVNAKNDLQGISTDTSLVHKRQSFNSLTDNLFQFLRVVHYDMGQIYLQECPMAFGDDQHGQWLSKTGTIRNPYLGLHHPKYHGAMVDCGETKDSINMMHKL